jgi:hypothetical protein
MVVARGQIWRPRPVELPASPRRRRHGELPPPPRWPRWYRPRPQFVPPAGLLLPEMLIKHAASGNPTRGPSNKPATTCSTGGSTPPPCWPCSGGVPATCLVTFADVVERSQDPDVSDPDCYDEWIGPGSTTVNRAFCLARDIPVIPPYCVSYRIVGLNAGVLSNGLVCPGGGTPDYGDVYWDVGVGVKGGAVDFCVYAYFSSTPTGGSTGILFNGCGGTLTCAGAAGVVANGLTVFATGASQFGKLGTATVDLWAGC